MTGKANKAVELGEVDTVGVSLDCEQTSHSD